MTAEGWTPVTGDDWMALIERRLRGGDLAGLTSKTRDGIEIRPLYTQRPARPAAALTAVDPARSARGWDVRTRHRVVAGGRSDPDMLRRRVDDDLAAGATSVELEVGEGVMIDELDRVLAGVDLSETPVALAPHASLGAAEALGVLAARRGGVLAAGSSVGLDPLGEWARSGRRVETAPAAEWARPRAGAPVGGGDRREPVPESIPDEIALAAGEVAKLGPGVRVFMVDATRYAHAGATEAQSLGWATATAVAYLRALVEAGMSVDAAAGLIGFRLAATADQFVTIAALRAARVMWFRVVTASGGSREAARQYQHAVTAAHMYSRRDPWVNLLRGASAALAAGVAGADAVTVLPFDHALGAVDTDAALGRRLARNTQLLLLEESHMARAGDPAGGSFYVESLTEELARAGWSIMQSTEAAGGISAVVADGSLEAAIDQRWEARLEALGTRREALVGVSEYPLLDDAVAGPDDGDVAAPAEPGLPMRRLAQPFEDLRDAADRHRLATGERPAVWVAALGPAAAHSERTAWVQSLLAVGGIEARGGEGVDSPIAAAADFAASGLAAAVITGSDDWYRRRGPATASALSEAGAVLVAAVSDPATPTDLLSDLQAAGASELWHQGINVVATLKRLHHILGIAGGYSRLPPTSYRG